MTIFTQKPIYQALKNHCHIIEKQRMQDWFLNDSDRFNTFSLQAGDLFLDYSKNLITTETLDMLIQLALDCEVDKKIQSLFKGDTVNFTEKRPALHTALRDLHSDSLIIDNKNILLEIKDVLAHMEEFVKKIQNHEWKGATGKAITDIVNIGIGGSHLGPMMAIQALKSYAHPKLRCHFISNMDELHIQETLELINPETTLFIISSKSFTTIETLSNAKIICNWLSERLGSNIQQHLVAVTAAPEKAIQFGIPATQIFYFWNWVGGRYSIWSAIGLPVALMIGMDNFRQFLKGAHQMDQHFHDAPLDKNMPVIMALLGIWYINFFNATQHAIIPYTHLLNSFPEYIQQLDMESNGKQAHESHDDMNYITGPVIFGKQGFDGQHSFFQLLHQGQHLIPVDFILEGHHQDILIASALSQAQALMQGKSYDQVLNELLEKNIPRTEAIILAKHKTIPGNRPSNVLILNQITPFNLGSLLALFEHKTYVQSLIWGINSFDQWGVELGKQLLTQLLTDIQEDSVSSLHDGSTQGLINYYKKIRSPI